MKRAAFALACALAQAESSLPSAPLGLDAYMPVPEDNPLTPDKVELGRRLFSDKRLSRDDTVSCASCHDPNKAFTDGRVLARGIGGAEASRNAPALINRGYGQTFFWDGRAETLERQALDPIFNPKELALTRPELEARTKMSSSEVAAALATYVRSIRSGASRYDKYVAGQVDALSAVEKAGLEIFRGKGHCVSCHVGPNFSDEQFHNTGVAFRDGQWTDSGRFEVTKDERERGAFKTPTLRELPLTAPYMHDGSFATLDAVIDYYSDGARPNPHLDAQIKPRRFTADEKKSLLAFLRSLTGTVSK
jgi:cytochrome c peroxidase